MKVINQNRGRFATALSVVALASLVACGGGGGGGTSAVTPPPIVCPAGGTAANNSACAAVTGTISIGDGVSVDDLFANGFATTTTGATQVPNVVDVKLVIGATEVGATVPLTLSNFAPTSFLNKFAIKPAVGTYTYVANLIDGLGRPFKIVKTFTTGGTACPAPAMANSLGTCMSPPVANAIWNSVMKAWAYPAGVLVVSLNTLPAACVTVGDACWMAKIADGTIKLVSTNAVQTGYNTRPIVFAVYKTFDGFFNEMPLYADVPALSPFAAQTVSNGGTSSNLTDVKGSDNGIKMTFPAFGCYERVHTGAGSWGNVKLDSCPI